MARHIVIVEDEAAIRHNYEDALHRYGYKVSGYGDKNSALAALKRRLPDLVIIDVGWEMMSKAGSSFAGNCAACPKACPSFS